MLGRLDGRLLERLPDAGMGAICQHGRSVGMERSKGVNKAYCKKREHLSEVLWQEKCPRRYT